MSDSDPVEKGIIRNPVGHLVILRAVFVRLVFFTHGTTAIWHLYLVTKDDRYCHLMVPLIILIFEAIITLCCKRIKEWKWFCPCVFLYLCSVVPSIWFLELHHHNLRLGGNHIVENDNTTDGLRAQIEGLGEVYIPIYLSSQEWILVIEQGQLLILIVGRWLLPKGNLTRNQLSQLLLVYLGTSADIVEFFEAIEEDVVQKDKTLTCILLALWSWSLLQFCMVFTATKHRGNQKGVSIQSTLAAERGECCSPNVYGIILSIIMQDAPFLWFRLTLIIYFKVLSYSNLFFTAKNTLVILLLIYRLICVQIEIRTHRREILKMEQIMTLDEHHGTTDKNTKTLDSNLEDV